MPKLKLTYFDVRARAEVIRLALVQGGEDFEDIRIKHEDWADLKPKVPNGALPFIEVDGQQIGESMAIARYIARKHKLMGKNDVEGLCVDASLEYLVDVRNKVWKAIFESDAAKKADLEKDLSGEVIPNFIKKMEKDLEDNKSGWLVGSSMTMADLCLYDFLETILKRPEGAKLSAPKCMALKAKVESQPNIKAYLAKRPESAF